MYSRALYPWVDEVLGIRQDMAPMGEERGGRVDCTSTNKKSRFGTRESATVVVGGQSNIGPYEVQYVCY